MEKKLFVNETESPSFFFIPLLLCLSLSISLYFYFSRLYHPSTLIYIYAYTRTYYKHTFALNVP